VSIEDAKWARGSKEARIIDTLEPVMNQHRLVVDRKLIERDYDSTRSYAGEDQQPYRLFYQMTRITKEKGCLAHDDRLDAVAGAVAYWLEHMGQHTKTKAYEAKRRKLEDELKRHVEHQLGRKVEPSSPFLRAIKKGNGRTMKKVIKSRLGL
jgi:hypothetical protein